MTFLDLFAGIGGFRLGMEQAGHKCLGHCEIDKFAHKSYMAMHDVKDDEWYANDIRNVRPEDLPEAECYCGGFPCQAFSIAGKRGGFEDMRGTLIFEVFRLVKAKRPCLLFLENVAGLLNHDNGRTFATIICGMDELGYDAEWQLLNSKDYGVPQNRERVFIVGHLRGTSGRKVFPLTRSNEKTLKQVVGGIQGQRIYIIGKDGKEKKKDYASCLTGGGHSGGNHSDMDLIIQLISMTQNSFKETDICQTLCASGPSRGKGNYNAVPGVLEVKAVLTPDREENEPMFTAQDKHGIYDGARIRRLTPKECFRLQGFPDELFEKARAVNSDSQLYKQAGNSVTVNVIYEIAKRLT